MNEYRLYHRTMKANAELILRDNQFCLCGDFKHHPGIYQPNPELCGRLKGVWLSNIPTPLMAFQIPRARRSLNPTDHDHGTVLLEVMINATTSFMQDQEWRREPECLEWFIPPAEINARLVSIRIMSRAEIAEVLGEPHYSMLEYQRLREDHFLRADIKRGNPLKRLTEVVEWNELKKG
jgi:hypothetical protein